MKKNNYIKPETKVYTVEPMNFLATSPGYETDPQIDAIFEYDPNDADLNGESGQ